MANGSMVGYYSTVSGRKLPAYPPNGWPGVMPPYGQAAYPPMPPMSPPGGHHGQQPPPPPPSQQQTYGQYHIYRQPPRSAAAPARQHRAAASLQSRYDHIISAPPPFPARSLPQPLPMRLREGREPSFNVQVKMPTGAMHSVSLATDDTVHDVKGVIERETGVPGAEIRLFIEHKELKDLSQSIASLSITADTRLDVQTFNARGGWGVAAVPEEVKPEEPPASTGRQTKEELEEWMRLNPGEAAVYKGYTSQSPSERGKILMEIYEAVMSRPPPGSYSDPRSETPCFFWANGKHCRNGDNRCPYSHAGVKGQGGFFFQRPDPRSKVVCNFFDQGKCLKGNMCPFKHNKPAQQQPQQQPDQFSSPPSAGFKGELPPQ